MPPKRKREESSSEESEEGVDSDEEFDLNIQPNGLPALPDLQQEGDIAQLPDNGYGQFIPFHQMGMMEPVEQVEQVEPIDPFPAMPFNLNQNFQGFDEFDDAPNQLFDLDQDFLAEMNEMINHDPEGTPQQGNQQGTPQVSPTNLNFNDEMDGAGRIPRRFLNNYV